MEFAVSLQDRESHGRLGRLTTGHGTIVTPAFMPVGTLGPIKGLEPHDVESLRFGLILNNAYHLYLRPGHQVVGKLGGLHQFTGWPGAILTDSGGFQVFSLAKLCRVTDEGVSFQSHLDGSLHVITPEKAIEIQEILGADIIMAFDQCVALPAPDQVIADAARRTALWARRCLSARRRTDQALFGIVQGGLNRALRAAAARDLVSLGFDGYALGGLSVGESKEEMYATVDVTVQELPANKPRYLMGVGQPEDLVEGVARGIDLFDCVIPSRHGRTGWLFTSRGRVVIKQAQYARDEQPIDQACECPVCRRYSRGYLHHLFNVKEMLGARLNTIHNLWCFANLMEKVRTAIAAGTFQQFREEFHRQRRIDDAGGAVADNATDLSALHTA
jgi:queuine tRNA-ribosyltransferase